MTEQLALEGNLMKGRDRLFEVYKHFRISEGGILYLRELMQVKLHNDQPATFSNRREYILGRPGSA